MAEYIDREALWYQLAKQATIDGQPRAIRRAAKIVADFPADDVRPVVLCMDCKFAPIGDRDGDDLEWPFNEFDENPCPYKCLDNWYSHKPAPDFFCADGEKREES